MKSVSEEHRAALKVLGKLTPISIGEARKAGVQTTLITGLYNLGLVAFKGEMEPDEDTGRPYWPDSSAVHITDEGHKLLKRAHLTLAAG